MAVRVRDLLELGRLGIKALGQFELTPTVAVPTKKKTSQNKSQEDNFAFQCRAFKLPPVHRHYRFAKVMGRQWQFDFAFADFKVAVEVEGLVVRRIGGELVCTGRHASVAGFREDCVKYASGALLGWIVLRFERDQVKSGYARDMTMRVLATKGWKPNHPEKPF